jgi:hypothetical protein
MLSEIWYAGSKLDSNSGKELASMAHISATSREKKAGPKALLFVVSPGNSMRNCCFPCACQAIEPEYAPFVLSICPVVYLTKQVNSSVGKAGGFVLAAA